MPEVEQVLYTNRELTELMVKDRGITSGHWAILVKFRFSGGNIDVEGATHPAAITLIDGIGLQRAEPSFPLAVDASKVSGSKRARARASQKST
ncbi:MAG: hypothetical protein Q8P22_07225 [Chloroflexota bacterium]|nr:hypothetical protein [Chloroflexota bacterium]